MNDIGIRATAANANSLQLQQVIPWPLTDYSHFRKCGEITVSADKQCFGFNCSFCPGICLDWEVFRQHICQEHGLDIAGQQRDSAINDQMLVDEVVLLEQQQQTLELSKQPTPAELMMMIMDMDMDVVGNDEDITNMLTMDATITKTIVEEDFDDDKRIEKSNWHEATTTTTSSTTIINTNPSVAAIEFENTQGLKETTKSTLDDSTSTTFGLFDVSSPVELTSTCTTSSSSSSPSLPYSMDIELLENMGISNVSVLDKATTTIDHSSLVTIVRPPPPPAPIVTASCSDKEGEFGMIYIVESPLAADLFSCSSSSPSQALDELEEATEEFTLALTEAVDPLVVDFDDVDEEDDDVDDGDETLRNATMVEEENMLFVESSHGTEQELPTTKGHHHQHHDKNNNYEDYDDDEFKIDVDKTNSAVENNNDDDDDDKEISADSRIATPAIKEEEYNDDIDIRKPLTQRELLRNKEIVGCIINVYEKHEKLWNPKHHQYKYNTKSSVYNELCEPLERDYKIRLSGADIFAVVKEVRGRYRRELTKCNACNDEKYKSNLWYFERMHFLRSVIEHRRTERLEAKIAAESTESEKSFETDSDQSSKLALYREALSYVINAYKRQESLWNPQHSDYMNCNKNELYHEISVQLNEDLQYEMSGEECFKEMQKIRTRYRKELRAIIMHKGLYIPTLWCFDEMDFLYKICQDQIFAKIGKKKGIIATQPKSKFLKANCIVFQDEESQLQFIEIYKNYPALWEVDHPDFRSTAYRNKALGQMVEEFNATFDITSTLEQLEKTLFQMRKDFSAEKQRILTTTHNEISNPSISLIHEKLSLFLEQNLGPFQCEICQKILKTSDQFKIHRSSHDGTMPFICTLCGKGFQTPCNLTVHIRRHRSDFPYACEKCEKRFATSTEVAIHMRTHTGERPYVCDLCGKTFKTWSFFDIHRRTHLNQSTFHCPICEKGFYEKNRFTDHMNCHLNIRKHLCNVCGKTFTTYSNLKKHTELHLTVKKYKCVPCGKRFAQFGGLRWHKLREHNNETYEQ